MTTLYQGVFTALVTPMLNNGELDLPALQRLVDTQCEAGIQGLIPCGTTGESATLSMAERERVITTVLQQANQRCPIIAGTGSNDTKTTIEQHQHAASLGVQAGLVVTPFYNKPTQEGLYRHYMSIAEASSLPIIAYNVPGRTGCDMKPETIVRLAKAKAIIGIKEATGDLERLSAIQPHVHPDFSMLSGDDITACAFTLMGGHGVISVVSNVAPAQTVAMIRDALQGSVVQARTMHAHLRDLINTLFIESNPIPAKTALHFMKHMQPHVRLPLCNMSDSNKKTLEAVLKATGLLG